MIRYKNRKVRNGNIQIHAKEYPVEVPLDLYREWEEMCKQLGFQNLCDPLDVELDNWLRENYRKTPQKKPQTQKITFNILSFLAPTYERWCEQKQIPIDVGFIRIMRKILMKYRKNTKKFFKDIPDDNTLFNK